MSVSRNDNVNSSLIQPPTVPPLRSPRAHQVARWFGLSRRGAYKRVRARLGALAQPLRLSAGTITLVTGPSGAGKSSLLRDIRTSSHRRILDVANIQLQNLPLVDLFDMPLTDTLRHLGRVGLGDAYSYLRTPAELSDGQRWRLRLALGIHQLTRDASKIHRQRPILLADEFCAVLDRLTAAVVAQALRRMIDAHRQIAALVATSHDDLSPALAPDAIVRCDFGGVEVQR